MKTETESSIEEPLTDTQMCYWAALIYGLRLINEKAQERPASEHFNADALVHFVRRKGDQLVRLMEEECGRPETKMPHQPVMRPKPVVISPFIKTETKVEMSPELPKKPSTTEAPKPKLNFDDGYQKMAEKRIDILLMIERKLAKEIEWLAKHGLTEKFDKAITAFQDAVGIRSVYLCRWCGYRKPSKGACPKCGEKSNTWSAKRASARMIETPTGFSAY